MCSLPRVFTGGMILLVDRRTLVFSPGGIVSNQRMSLPGDNLQLDSVLGVPRVIGWGKGRCSDAPQTWVVVPNLFYQSFDIVRIP